MKDTVERLLEAETRAEQVVAEARAACDRIVEEARTQAHSERQQFEKNLPKLRQEHLDQARQRAAEACREERRRHQQRSEELRATAAANRAKALDAALALLLDPGAD